MRCGREPLAEDDEVDAVAVLGLSVVDVREAGGRVVLDLGQRHGLAGERRQRAADDHDQARAPRRRQRPPLRAPRAARACGEQPPRPRTARRRASRRGARSAPPRSRPCRGGGCSSSRGARGRPRPSPGRRSASCPPPDRERMPRRRPMRSRARPRSSLGRSGGPGGVASFSAAPRTIWLRITPELPRAPISAARATARTISGRFGSPSAEACSSRSSSSITCRRVSAMLSPVSPSATGNTFRSLISWRLSSRCE